MTNPINTNDPVNTKDQGWLDLFRNIPVNKNRAGIHKQLDEVYPLDEIDSMGRVTKPQKKGTWGQKILTKVFKSDSKSSLNTEPPNTQRARSNTAPPVPFGFVTTTTSSTTTPKIEKTKTPKELTPTTGKREDWPTEPDQILTGEWTGNYDSLLPLLKPGLILVIQERESLEDSWEGVQEIFVKVGPYPIRNKDTEMEEVFIYVEKEFSAKGGPLPRGAIENELIRVRIALENEGKNKSFINEVGKNAKRIYLGDLENASPKERENPLLGSEINKVLELKPLEEEEEKIQTEEKLENSSEKIVPSQEEQNPFLEYASLLLKIETSLVLVVQQRKSTGDPWGEKQFLKVPPKSMRKENTNTNEECITTNPQESEDHKEQCFLICKKDLNEELLQVRFSTEKDDIGKMKFHHDYEHFSSRCNLTAENLTSDKST